MNKPYLYYYQNSSLLTYHPSSKTNMDPALVMRGGHDQLVHQRSKTSTNIAIILINAIYKKFYECWSSYTTCVLAYSKTLSQTYESLIKFLAYVSTHSSANAFPIRWLSEKSSWSSEELCMKWQEDSWLVAVREPTFRTSTSAFFHQSSIGDQSLLIISDLNRRESRLGLDGPADLDCRLDG